MQFPDEAKISHLWRILRPNLRHWSHANPHRLLLKDRTPQNREVLAPDGWRIPMEGLFLWIKYYEMPSPFTILPKAIIVILEDFLKVLRDRMFPRGKICLTLHPSECTPPRGNTIFFYKRPSSIKELQRLKKNGLEGLKMMKYNLCIR